MLITAYDKMVDMACDAGDNGSELTHQAMLAGDASAAFLADGYAQAWSIFHREIDALPWQLQMLLFEGAHAD